MDRGRDSGFGLPRATSRGIRNSRCALVVAAVALTACTRAPQPDAYGNVEASEVIVSSEVGGQLTTFTVEEGQTLARGDKAGTIDPTQLSLQRSQAVAQRDGASSRAGEFTSQFQVLMAQRDALQAQHDAASAQRGALQAQLEVARRNHPASAHRARTATCLACREDRHRNCSASRI